MTSQSYRGRIAPTTSGYLHVGHAQTFKTAMERARESGGTLVLRIEDIDFERCKKKYAEAAVEDLKSIGIQWDEGDDIGGNYAPYTQSLRMNFYVGAFKKLLKSGKIYPCQASRKQIAELSTRQKRTFDFLEPEKIFPRQLRRNCVREFFPDALEKTWRFKVPDGEKIEFFDNAMGAQSFIAGEDFGDFVIWRKIGVPSYEFAVVVDDAAMEITEVVRGKDLLLSTARQLLLYEALDLRPPQFYHCPLVMDKNGKKLSKSNTDPAVGNPSLIRSQNLI